MSGPTLTDEQIDLVANEVRQRRPKTYADQIRHGQFRIVRRRVQ